jgi:hypothetical protein
VRCGGGADQEQAAGAAGGSHGGDRPGRQAGGEVSQAAVCLLLDGGGAVGMVVGDDGLAALGEGGEFAEVGVLDRPGAVRGERVPGRPDAVVGIGEDQVTAGCRRQCPLRPGPPPRLTRARREVSQVEQVAEETSLRAEDAGAGERGGAALPGADDAGEPLVQVRVELVQPPG